MKMKARMKGGPRHKPTSLQVMVKGIQRGLWPTPTVADSMGSRGTKGKDRPNEGGLLKAVRWRTPNANEWKNASTLEEGQRHTLNLRDQVRTWPTATAREWRNSAGKKPTGRATETLAAQAGRFPTATATSWKNRESSLREHILQKTIRGQLNADWVEALMGLPPGWTDVEDGNAASHEPRTAKRIGSPGSGASEMPLSRKLRKRSAK